jgi:fatty-acyl-CoA synthase
VVATQKLVGDLLRVNARNLPRQVALVCGAERFTYADINRRANRVASALTGAGIGPGDVIAVLARNSIDYFCLYFATAKIGAIIVPLNFWNRARQHADVFDEVHPALLFLEPEFETTGQDAVRLAARAPEVVILTPILSAAADASWERFLSRADGDGEPAAEVGENDPHMILYTSGTTGRSKGAVLSHRRTMDDAIAMAAVLGVRQSDVYVNWHTPFHVANWDHQKFFLVMGATVVLMGQFDAGLVLETVERERATVLLAVPVMLSALLDHPRFAATDFGSLRLLYYGAYDPSGIMRRTAQALGADEGRIEMVHTYGLTEAGCIVTACPADQLFTHWGSIGRPVPGVEVRLAGPTDEDVPVGSPGEILVRGPMMTRYWGRPDDTAAAIEAGWLRTGDVAVADEDGFLRIVDRKKDMIRSGGQNVYSKEVEDCLAGHPRVAQVAVIGVPDPVYEEAVCAVVVLNRGADDQERHQLDAEIKAWVRERLAGYNTPKAVRFVDQLPANSLGKTIKGELRQRFGSMFATGAHQDSSAREPGQ